MKLMSAVILSALVVAPQFSASLSIQPAFNADLAWSQFKDTFTTSYKSALGILQNEALAPLASAKLTSVWEAASSPEVIAFDTAIKRFSSSISVLYVKTLGQKTRLDSEMRTNLVNLKGKEDDMNQRKKLIEELRTSYAVQQQQLATAKAQFDSAHNSYLAAERDLANAEERVAKARNCVWRGKRGFLGKVWREIKRPIKQVVNLPCHINNNINKEKANRQTQSERRDTMLKRFNDINAIVNSQAAQLAQLSARQTTVANEHAALNAAILAIRTQITKATEIGQLMGGVADRLTAANNAAEMLDKVALLEEMVEPLQRLGARVVDVQQQLATGLTDLFAAIRKSVAAVKTLIANLKNDEEDYTDEPETTTPSSL